MSTKPHTALGSPCSPAWDTGWIEVVEDAEQKAGRRLCGARTLDGTPCTLEPGHENGRCRYHGGFNLTGAQPGNRNAVIHGLYARGLQRCGKHCPQWASCPLPNLDAETGEGGGGVHALPAHKRPVCPYETTQFQTALTDLLAAIPDKAGGHCRHLAHQAALLEVMTQRAAAAMGVTPLVDAPPAGKDVEEAVGAKPAATLTAFTRLAAEHRRTLLLFHQSLKFDVKVWRDEDVQEADFLRQSRDTELTPEAQAELFCDPSETTAQARKHLAEAESRLDGFEKLREEHLNKEYEVCREHDEFYSPDGTPTPRTRHGFLHEKYEKAFLSEVARWTAEALQYYRRAFRLEPRLYAAYGADPDREEYVTTLGPEVWRSLAPWAT